MALLARLGAIRGNLPNLIYLNLILNKQFLKTSFERTLLSGTLFLLFLLDLRHGFLDVNLDVVDVLERDLRQLAWMLVSVSVNCVKILAPSWHHKLIHLLRIFVGDALDESVLTIDNSPGIRFLEVYFPELKLSQLVHQVVVDVSSVHVVG